MFLLYGIEVQNIIFPQILVKLRPSIKWSFKYNIIPNGKPRVKRNKQILPSLSFSVWYDIT